MEIGTGLTVLGAVAGGAKVIEKILGPTADYLGTNLKDWTQKRVENTGKVFQAAEKKLGDRINQEGSVPPKVLKNILEEGAFCEDRLSAEYFGGVLASSRSEVPRDDRGAAFASLVGRLTTYQIRTHFFLYSAWRSLFRGTTFNIALPKGRHDLELYIPIMSYVRAMEFSDKEDAGAVMTHAVIGLVRESLIDDNYNIGPHEHIKNHFSDAPDAGMLLRPSPFGVELFHWAHGRGDIKIHHFLDPTLDLKSEVNITTTPGICGTKNKGNDRFRAPQDPPVDSASFRTSTLDAEPHGPTTDAH